MTATSVLACRICEMPTVFTSRVCRYCADERKPFLAMLHAELLLNGVCVGQLQYDEPAGGTCLVVTWCGCPDGRHEEF